MAFITDSLRSAIGAVASRFGLMTSTGLVSTAFSNQLALAAYQSSGMLRKVIAIPAADRTQKWRDWQADKEQIKLIEAEEKRHGLQAKTKAAEILRGCGGGALLIVTAGDHASELKPETIAKGGLVAVNLLSRWQIHGEDWVKEITDPAYGTPRKWKIDGTGSQQTVHPSRIICFRGEPLPAGSAVSDEESFWGDSKLLRVYTEVQRSDETKAWFSALVRKAKLLRIGIPKLSDFTATEGGQTRLNGRIEVIASGESALNATVYDAGDGSDGSGEKISDYQITWSGIPEIMDAFDQAIAAVSDIPFTRLMGRSPAGMNATGKSDQDNYWTMVADGQENETRPCLEMLDPLLLRSAGVAKPEDVTWKWAPLVTTSEAEEAATFDKTMDAVTKLQNTGTIPDIAFAKGVQNLMAEREYIPGLDQALAEIPEDERFGIEATGEEEDLVDPNAEGGDPAISGEDGDPVPPRRAANDAWMIEDWAAKTLYVRRDVLNRADIVKWATAQGFTDIVPDLHVTITYSTTPVDWMTMGESWRGKLEVEAGGPRLVEALGPDGKYKALLFTAWELVSRNSEMREKGASFDWPEYQPHISIQVGGDIDLAKVEPYVGKIVLGPEIFEEIRA